MHRDQQVCSKSSTLVWEATNEAYIYLDLYEFQVSFHYVRFSKILEIANREPLFEYFSDLENVMRRLTSSTIKLTQFQFM